MAAGWQSVTVCWQWGTATLWPWNGYATTRTWGGSKGSWHELVQPGAFLAYRGRGRPLDRWHRGDLRLCDGARNRGRDALGERPYDKCGPASGLRARVQRGRPCDPVR